VKSWDFGICLSFQPRRNRFDKEREHIVLGQLVRWCMSVDGSLVGERSRAARAADSCHNVRTFGRGIERELDVIVARPIQRKTKPPGRSEHRERVALGFEGGDDLAGDRRRDLLQERFEGALRLGRLGASALRAIARGSDGALHALPHDRNFHRSILARPDNLDGAAGVKIEGATPRRTVMPHRCAVLMLCVAAPVAATAQEPRAAPVVVMSGEGLIQAPPDRAWVMVTAESRASSAREAQRRNADAMAPVQEKLRASGVPGDAIRTSAYDLQQEWDVVNNRRVPRGYVARNTIEVRVDGVDRLGELLETAVASGATSVGGIRFDLKDRVKLEREALRLAVADARAKAEAAAAGGGRTIERIIRIEEQGIPIRPPIPYATLREAAQVADAPPISPGQIELRAQVTLTAELK
jgi:uncharacterized protein